MNGRREMERREEEELGRKERINEETDEAKRMTGGKRKG